MRARIAAITCRASFRTALSCPIERLLATVDSGRRPNLFSHLPDRKPIATLSPHAPGTRGNQCHQGAVQQERSGLRSMLALETETQHQKPESASRPRTSVPRPLRHAAVSEILRSRSIASLAMSAIAPGTQRQCEKTRNSWVFRLFKKVSLPVPVSGFRPKEFPSPCSGTFVLPGSVLVAQRHH